MSFTHLQNVLYLLPATDSWPSATVHFGVKVNKLVSQIIPIVGNLLLKERTPNLRPYLLILHNQKIREIDFFFFFKSKRLKFNENCIAVYLEGGGERRKLRKTRRGGKGRECRKK